MAFLAPIGIAAASGLVGTVGSRVGKKLSDLLGLKKGGVVGQSNHAVKQRLQRATVKKTGIHTLPVGSMVLPANLSKKIKAVANRRPKKVKGKKIKQMKNGGISNGKRVLLHKDELVISPNPYKRHGRN